MQAIDKLRAELPEVSKDLRINLQSIFESSALSAAQMWGVGVACAIATRNTRLRAAVISDAREVVDPAVLEDATAAATLMGMNNVFYRFRHLVGKASYNERPARLRMQRLARPATNRADFELFCLAVSAINNCETCIKSHESSLIEAGLSEDHIHDAARIAAVLAGVCLALETGVDDG